MRDLRARIAQRHGIDLSASQLHELAARRLEAILDPRTIKPALLDEFRRSAADTPAATADAAGYDFTETTIYESHRGGIRLLRRLLNPLLMLFVNLNPIARALAAQSKINKEAADRAAEQLQRQAEWNALHYEIVQRLVTEISRLSLEVQSLTGRVESLGGRVDFNDKRVRALETHPGGAARQPHRPAETATAPATAMPATGQPDGSLAADGGAEPARRKRRRRRGRRPGTGWPEGAQGAPGADTGMAGSADEGDTDDDVGDEAQDEERGVTDRGAEAAGSAPDRPSPAAADAAPRSHSEDVAASEGPVQPEPPPLDR